MRNNVVTAIAKENEREYITPEDVEDAFRAHPEDPHLVRIDVLEVLGGTTGFGAEDSSLCAFLAFMGPQVRR